ncbi:hypothetical protein MYU51_011245 [Penicillium brevicompactum]
MSKTSFAGLGQDDDSIAHPVKYYVIEPTLLPPTFNPWALTSKADYHDDTFEGDETEIESITVLDSQTERLVRSRHPSLRQRNVWVTQPEFGQVFWFVDSPLDSSKSVYAGGRPIHYFPGRYDAYISRRVSKPYGDGRNWYPTRNINPRRFLRPAQLESVRNAFPKAIGVEIRVAGFMVVLYEHMKYVRLRYRHNWPLWFAGLRVEYDVALDGCTAAAIEHKLDVDAAQTRGSETTRSQCRAHSACVGLKVMLQNGSVAITTRTHDMMSLAISCQPRESMGFAFQEWVAKIRGLVMTCRSIWARRCHGLTNHSAGTGASLSSLKEDPATVIYTYDQPSPTKSYPTGYDYDLSLIMNPVLPKLSSPPGYPPITGWGECSAALRGDDAYVVCQVVEVDSPSPKSPHCVKRERFHFIRVSWHTAIAHEACSSTLKDESRGPASTTHPFGHVDWLFSEPLE